MSLGIFSPIGHVWLCPKCGAETNDVQHVEKHNSYMDMLGFKHEANEKEHLKMSCGRCAWAWKEDPLDEAQTQPKA